MRKTEIETASREDRRIFKEFTAKAQALDGRRVRFVITTSTPDREGDVVAADGVETTGFMSNPVVLFAHDYHSLPIGRCVDLTREPTRLLATIEFAAADLNPMAEQIYGLVKAGYLRAVSIGFRPLEWTYDEQRGGVNFVKVELLEISVVPVPANAEALQAASARGIDVSLLKQWAGRVLAEGRTMGSRHDGPGLLIRDADPNERVAIDPVALAEAIRDAVGDVVARATYIAICEASGRVPDADWTPPRRTRSATPRPSLGPLGRFTVLSEAGLAQRGEGEDPFAAPGSTRR